MDKKALRQEILKKRESMKKTEVENMSREIFNHLKKNNYFQSAKCVFIYCSYKNEVDTTEIIEYLFKEKKRVVVPYITGVPGFGEGNNMFSCEIKSFQDLKPGYMGILQPVPQEGGIAGSRDCMDDIDLCIVPGVAFDKEGSRIGYGKGFYDRYLSRLKERKKGKDIALIGIAYDFQVLEYIETECHDIKMDMVQTTAVTKKL